jgi:3-isopropylmalate/(R)-2-methylmalate dehydratase small subunit
MAGVSAILAKSVARIFFRNAINQGLPVLICDTDKIDVDDILVVNLPAGKITDLTKNTQLTFGKIPPVMLDILTEGGLISYIKKHGDFKLQT